MLVLGPVHFVRLMLDILMLDYEGIMDNNFSHVINEGCAREKGQKIYQDHFTV